LYKGQGNRILDTTESVTVDETRVSAPATKPLNEVVVDLACASDAVLVGAILSAESFPTEDGTLLFTEYTVRPTQIFRAANGAAVTPAGNVTVVRPGGEMSVAGKVVKAVMSSFPPLSVGGRYVLFLKNIKGTTNFETAIPEGVFRLAGSQVEGTRRVNATDEDLISSPLPAERIFGVLRNMTCR
jgi:hypothetical protein